MTTLESGWRLSSLSIFSFLYKDNPSTNWAGLRGPLSGILAGLPSTTSSSPISSTNCSLILFKQLGAIDSDAAGHHDAARMFPKLQWLSLYPLALMVGTSAAMSMLLSFKSDFVEQMAADDQSFPSSPHSWHGGSIMLIVGTLCGVFFFYFSKKQEALQSAFQDRNLV